MEKSESISSLATALSKFQSQLVAPRLDREVEVRMKTGGFFKFKYATFAECTRVARELLGKCELSVIQLVEEDYSVLTILAHSSGEYISSKFRVPGITNDSQSLGAAISYAKRYAYCAILGIVADEDTDGQGADANFVVKKETEVDRLIAEIEAAKSTNELTAIYNGNEAYRGNGRFMKALREKKKMFA